LLGGSGVNTYDRPGGKAAVVRSSDELDDEEVSLGGVGGVYSITRAFYFYGTTSSPSGWGDVGAWMYYGGQTGTGAGFIEVPWAGTLVGFTVNYNEIISHSAGNGQLRILNEPPVGTTTDATVSLDDEDEDAVTGQTMTVSADDHLNLEGKWATASQQVTVAAEVTVFIRADDEI
jgi:hypothetical protein